MAMYKRHKHESGNALWFILLAVALLAALTATISRSTDTAEQSGNIERFRVHASAVMRHATGIKEAVNTLRLRSVGENQMSFNVSFLSAALYANPNCTEIDCLVYGSAGGGGSYEIPSPDWLDSDHSTDPRYGTWEFSGANLVTDIGTARPELIMYIGYLRANLCAQINAMLSIPGGVPTDANNFDPAAFAGVYDDASPQTIDNMAGNEAGCFYDPGGRENTFYQVLIKR